MDRLMHDSDFEKLNKLFKLTDAEIINKLFVTTRGRRSPTIIMTDNTGRDKNKDVNRVWFGEYPTICSKDIDILISKFQKDL